MTMYLDPDIDGGPGDPGGGGGGLPPVFARLSPASQTIAAGGQVTLVPDFAGGAGVLTPGSIPCTTGVPVSLSVSTTTTYTLTVGAGLATATATVTVGGIPSAVTRYLDLTWPYTEPTPGGTCQGFEVVIYTGTNPNDTNAWLGAPQWVPATDRRLVRALSLIPPRSISAAVRAIYATGRSSWSPIAAAISFA